MRYTRFALPGALLLVVGVVLIISSAASGRTARAMGTFTCGTPVTTSFTLSASVDCTSGPSSTALIIGASGITVNLNGKTITAHSSSNNCIDDDDDYNNVTITNGTLDGCSEGVYIEGASGSVLSKLTINSPSSIGIYEEDGASNTVSNDTVNTPGGEGFEDYYSGGTQFVSDAVSLGSAAGTIYGFYLESNSQMTVKSSSVTGGTASDYGVYMDEDNNDTYTGDTASGADYGFYLDCGDSGAVTVTGNSASHESEDGFYVEDCYNDEAYESGTPTPGTTISGNSSSSNGDDGFYDEYNPGALVSANIAKGNTSEGFYFEEIDSETITGNTANNTVSGDGFYIDETGGSTYSEYAPASFTKNVANNNNGYGFDSDYGGMAGTSNRASSNTTGGTYWVGGVSGQD